MTITTGSIRWACALVAVGMLGIAPAVRAETLENAEKAVTAQWEKIKSATYDTEMSSVNEGQGYSMKMSLTGKNEMQRSGETVKLRTESKSVNDMTAGGNTTKTESVVLMVVDGEFAYNLMDTAGTKMCMKMKAQTYSDGAGGKGFFKMLHDTYNLALLPDENIDGKAVYVFEAKDKKGAGGVTKYFISKENGMVVEMLTVMPDGKSKTTMKVTNLKIDASIPADHFKFTPPAGVTVMDQTKQ